MKKEYKDLELEVVDFAAEDVITASGGDCPKNCAPDKVPCPHAICKCNGPVEIICRCDGPYECIVG